MDVNQRKSIKFMHKWTLFLGTGYFLSLLKSSFSLNVLTDFKIIFHVFNSNAALLSYNPALCTASPNFSWRGGGGGSGVYRLYNPTGIRTDSPRSTSTKPHLEVNETVQCKSVRCM